GRTWICMTHSTPSGDRVLSEGECSQLDIPIVYPPTHTHVFFSRNDFQSFPRAVKVRKHNHGPIIAKLSGKKMSAAAKKGNISCYQCYAGLQNLTFPVL